MGESPARRITRNWHPLDPVLVSAPGMERLLPPICIPDMTGGLQNRMLQQHRLYLLLMVCMIAGFAVAALCVRDTFFFKAAISVSLLFVFALLQYNITFKNVDRLRTYSRFCSWCYLQPPTQTIAIAFMMLLVGGVQYYLQARIGNLFDLIERYGLVFKSATHQPWRYIVGPFLHANLTHWIENVSMLVVAAGLAFSLGNVRTIWSIFFAGIVVPGFCLNFLPHWVGLDALLGISGGIYAIYGWVVGIALRHRRHVPYGLWWYTS